MIIIDDCSYDGSKKIIKEFMKRDGRIKLIELDQNKGPALARNIGTKIARGNYIAFLDSDDIWMPEKLETQIGLMESNGANFCYSSYFIIDEQDKLIDVYTILTIRVSYYQLLRTNSIGTLTAIYNAERIGKFEMQNIKSKDYALWLKILKK